MRGPYRYYQAIVKSREREGEESSREWAWSMQKLNLMMGDAFICMPHKRIGSLTACKTVKSLLLLLLRLLAIWANWPN